jgi:sporulation protein YlmC with PRC-barrel domain
MGKVQDIMLNITTGKIEYVVIEFGGFLTIGEKYFAIPFNRLTIDPVNKAFIFDQPREVLEKAPGFDLNHWPETNFHAEETYWDFV